MFFWANARYNHQRLLFLHHLQSVYSTILVAFLFHQLKIRTSLTGKHHGSEGRNCSDFCSTFHFTNLPIGFLPPLVDIAFKQYLSFTSHFRQPSFFHFQKRSFRTRKHHGSLSGSRRGLTSLLNSSEKITYWLTNSPAFAINPWLVLNQYLLYTCHILGIFWPFSLTGSTTAISWTETLLVITCCFFGCCCQRNSYSLACPPCCQPGSADSI